MKKIISFVLCLSIALTCFVGIASAETINNSFKPSFTETAASVITEDCRTTGKRDYYASIKVTAKGTFIRGTGLSDEGRSYTASKTSKTGADNPGEATSKVHATATGKNARDYLKSGSGSASGTYTWRSITD